MILMYDIMLDEKGKTILRKVFKICKKYLIHIQNSVFEGDISESQYFCMKNELKKYLRDNIDSCLTFYSSNKKWLRKEFLAKEDIEKMSQFI
jgi:CRISPR-associated protein Cas2